MRLRPLVVAAVLGALLAGCSGSPAPRPTPSAAPSDQASCTLGALAVPSCGVLWGVATKPPTTAGVARVEQALGRPFDFVYRYHDVNDEVPDAQERAIVRSGRLLHIAIAARDFSHPELGSITWKDVADGRYDATLLKQAQGVASLKVPVFVTFEQEANQRRKRASLGAPQDYVRAWRHLHDLYQQAGATNAVWTWVMTGSADNLAAAGTLWPGNDVVDWISWNVYNQAGCPTGRVDVNKYVSFEDKLLVFLTWLQKQGPSRGIDPAKPLMISETGSAKFPGQPDLAAQWYAGIPAALRKHPQIKAVALWSSVDGPCDYTVDSVPEIAAAAGEAGRDSWLDLHGALRPQPFG